MNRKIETMKMKRLMLFRKITKFDRIKLLRRW